MKIRAGEQLSVRGFFHNVLIDPHDVMSVSVTASHNILSQGPLGWLYRGRAYPEAVTMQLPNKSVQLKRWDDGFSEALDWLRSCGWLIDEAAESAVKTPYVRVQAQK